MDNAKFCKNCGAKMNANAHSAGVPEPPVYEKSYTVHIIVGYILDIIFPLLGLILGIYLMTRKDSETANTQGKYVLIVDRKSTRLNSSHPTTSRMPSSA